MNKVSRRKFATAHLAVFFALASLGLAGSRADAQCQVLQQPSQFDPPVEALQPSDMYARADSLAIGGPANARRLVVRYSYGFLVYDLGTPGTPRRNQTRSLKYHDGYPKNGDGLERTNGLAMSSDAARVVIPWSDTVGFGTVALSLGANGFSGGGDFPPSGATITRTALAHIGSRYIGFSLVAGMTGSSKLYAADVTTLQPNVTASDETKNMIPSELISGVDFGGRVGRLSVVEGQSRVYVIAASAQTVTVIDVTTVGASIPGLTSSFTSRSYSLAELGISSGMIRTLSGAIHPADGSLHLYVEAAVKPGTNNTSTGTSLSRIAPGTGQPSVVGSYYDASSPMVSVADGLLLAFDDSLMAVFFGQKQGLGLDVHVRSSTDFSRNLASGLRFTTVEDLSSLAGFRTGGTIYLYVGRGIFGTYAASLNCATAPVPATASLSVEKLPKTGPAEPVVDGGTVFVGDTLRIKPVYSPPDAIQPIIDWRLDYDFHSGNALEGNSSATGIKLSNPDESRTKGPLLPNAEYLLTGPCDPKGLPDGGGAVPSTGVGCWASVTSNGTYTTSGSPDFVAPPAEPVAGSTKELTIAFEAQNSLNAGGSGLATHKINWKVPAAVLKSPALLAGGSVEIEPQGTPADTGFKWYFASAPVGQAGEDALSLRSSCSGPTCNPSLTQSGTYRYWVSVPYKNGFQTPDCPGLSVDLQSCTGDAAKTVQVTDVVLKFTVPTGGIVGTPTLSIQSQSAKAAIATPCPAGSTGFTYDLCTLSGGNCPEGTYSGPGLLAPNPFPTSGTGSLTIPMPGEGAWGVRLKYRYTTTGTCGDASATWPGAGAATAWAPISVIKAQPTIKLRNSTNTADIPFSPGFGYSVTKGQAARAYVYLNGVQDQSPPAGLQWSYTNTETNQTLNFGAQGPTGQGATFPTSTVGTYEINLAGYGIAATPVTVDVSSSGGGGGGPAPLSATSVSVSPSSPVLGQSASFTCNAAGGTPPYEYSIVYGDGNSGSSRTTTHTYTSLGGKTVVCSVTDAAQDSDSVQRTVTVVNDGDVGGTCDVKLSGPGGVIQAYQGEYYVSSGQQLTMEALNATGTASWDFGDGQFGSGTPVTHVYANGTDAEVQVTLKLTAGSCSKTYKVFISPSAGPDFTVADAGTGIALEWAADAYKASAGQSLKFTSTGTTGDVSWDFGDGTFSAEAGPVKTYAPAVDTNYVVKLTNNAKSKQANVKVAGSTGAALTGNFAFAYADGSAVSRGAVEPNKAIRFTGIDQATTYTWDFGDGTSLGQGSPAEHTFTRGGAFTVKLTVARDGVPGTVTTASPLTFTVKTPPDPLLWVAGGMVYADGLNGERFQSDMSIFNPSSQVATVSLGFVAGASWDGASKVEWIQEPIGGNQTRAYANVLESLFRLNKGAWGVVLVRGDSVPVAPVIVSRTYNAANADLDGTFGLSVPAMSVAGGVKPQSSAGSNFLAGLRHDAAFRTNLTVANLKDEAAEVEFVFRGSDGAVLGSPARIIIEPRGVKQLNAALSAAPPTGEGKAGGAGWVTPASHFSAEMQLKKGSGVYPYATVIDQGTGDSIVVTPAPRPSPAYRLPGILHLGQWVSDVSLLNPSAKERKVRVEYSFVKKGESDRTAKSKSLTLRPFEMQVWVDFFKSVLELAPEDTSEYSESYVDISPASDDAAKTEPLIVSGKTYTASGKGSIGLQIDPYVFEDGIGAQATARRILLSGLEANQRFRTNLAVFLTPGATAADQAEVDVHIYDFRGRELRSIYVMLNADTPVKQINSDVLLAGLTTNDTDRASIVINNLRGTARVGAYATVIDNKSNDATFVAGQPVP